MTTTIVVGDTVPTATIVTGDDVENVVAPKVLVVGAPVAPTVAIVSPSSSTAIIVNDDGPMGRQGEPGRDGPPGPPGPPGPASTVQSYTFTQAVPIKTWVINHNMGFKPHIILYTTGGIEVEAQIVHNNDQQAVAYFNNPFAGSARCI